MSARRQHQQENPVIEVEVTDDKCALVDAMKFIAVCAAILLLTWIVNL